MPDLITVTIPTYNGEKYLQETIESILSQKMNTEIIVVDDQSTDKTVEIAQKMGCRVIINQTHRGQVAGKNTGIIEGNGKFWLTIDQDDKLAKGALNRLYTEITKSDSRNIVMAKLQDFCSPDTPEQSKFCKREPFSGILTGSTLFRTSVFDEIGLFREDVITGDVIDLTNRLILKKIEIIKIDFVTCHRRIHNLNYGRTNQKDEYKDYAKILRERIKLNTF